jgi:hypothetical protein
MMLPSVGRPAQSSPGTAFAGKFPVRIQLLYSEHADMLINPVAEQFTPLLQKIIMPESSHRVKPMRNEFFVQRAGVLDK